MADFLSAAAGGFLTTTCTPDADCPDGLATGGRIAASMLRGLTLERAGRHADPPVLRLRGDIVRLGLGELQAAGGEARFHLRHVGAGDFAGGESVARRSQRHLEHVHVAALRLEDGRSPQQVHERLEPALGRPPSG